MQKVIAGVRATLTDLRLAIEGSIIMNEALRDALNSIFDAKVPSTWAKVFLLINFFILILGRTILS